eukprot:406128-Rhodomonas_salina.1
MKTEPDSGRGRERTSREGINGGFIWFSPILDDGFRFAGENGVPSVRSSTLVIRLGSIHSIAHSEQPYQSAVTLEVPVRGLSQPANIRTYSAQARIRLVCKTSSLRAILSDLIDVAKFEIEPLRLPVSLDLAACERALR